MKRLLKQILALSLALIMVFGVYLPISRETLLDSFSVQAQAASIPAVPDYLDYYLLRCKDDSAHIAFSTLNGSYTYRVELSNSDYGYSMTNDISCSVAKTMYIFYDLGSLASTKSSINFNWVLKITTYSGNTKGPTRTWSGLIDNSCAFISMPINYYGIYFGYNDGSENYFIQDWPSPCSGTTRITTTQPTRNGYRFLGWSTNPSATTPSYYPGDTVSYDHDNLSLQAVWSPNTYTVKYNANGGSGSMSSSTHTYDQSKALSGNKFTRSGYNFLGWSTSSGATSATYSDGQSVKNLTSTNGATVNLYAIWSKNVTYTVSYNANGGTGAPSSQTKEKDVTLTLRSTTPSKSYTVSYNANGGSVSSSSKTVSCTFKNWNTSSSGSGTTYYPGGSYTSNSSTTLYAQWTNPTYGTLPTPTRSGYTFNGWYTSSTGGTKITSSSTVTGNTTIYAHWTQDADEYNLGEETYRFENYSDALSQGHCFGMSVTSSGYHLGKLDIKTIGGSATKDLYMLSFNSTVSAPICHYQKIQGIYIANATVAGDEYINTSSDWNEVVNYVKNHQYDDTGKLVIILSNSQGGHAVNFLRYSEVNGQARIYAYDNNFPTTETYFYLGTNGKVKQAPRQTFSMDIDNIGLMDTTKYLDGTDDFNAAKYIYADSNTVTVSGATAYDMYCSSGKRIMYEIPANATQVTIVPLKENAEFEYLDKKYEFNAVNEDTYGVLTLSTGSGYNQTTPKLEIKNEPKEAKSIVIKKLPTNTTCMYKYGGVNLAGIELEVTYVDGTRETVTDASKMHVSNFTPLTTGTQTVTVEYCGARASLDVTVRYTWWQWIIVILLFGWIWY